MSATPNPNHHVCIHGHFYQPPRENPWLGVIERQGSAAPFSDWNERINAECYSALTHSHVLDDEGRIDDLFNNFAHMSFNIGPTLNSWLEKHDPETLRRIRLGAELSRKAYKKHCGALAQAYNHPILPLCDARDRHTQILWGIAEYVHRYGFKPEGMWLPECGINMDTVRLLIDHGIRFVILAPQQSEAVRMIGTEEWTQTPYGSVETRQPYRLFEVDGGGRTHYHRYLDVFFYDRGISLKVSFEHLLRDPDRLAWFVRERLDNDATLPQIVLVATDGEAYGHHERGGNDTLAQFFSKFLKSPEIDVGNLSLYLADNPPTWEVKLWHGVDGKGSSWSCDHGVGRWMTDCGCHTGGDDRWNQAWRQPLRNSFDHLRHLVRKALHAEGHAIFRDYWDARDDYIAVLLNPSDENRAAFLKAHARGALCRKDEIKAWRLLEADLNAMLMYTSCGWFFCELSGLEPVQNMRYALRAAELAQPYLTENLTQVLQETLSAALSNIPEEGNGCDIFNKHVLTTRFTPEQIAAAHMLCRLAGIPEPLYVPKVSVCDEKIRTREKEGVKTSSGSVDVFDPRTTESWSLRYFCMIRDDHTFGALVWSVGGSDDKAAQTKMKQLDALPAAELSELIEREGISARNLPWQVRDAIFRNLFSSSIDRAEGSLYDVYDQAKPLLQKLIENGIELPVTISTVASHALEARLTAVVRVIAKNGVVRPEEKKAADAILSDASSHRITIDRTRSTHVFSEGFLAKLEDIRDNFRPNATVEALAMWQFAENASILPQQRSQIEDCFWEILHLSARPRSERNSAGGPLWELGHALGFSHERMNKLLDILFCG